MLPSFWLGRSLGRLAGRGLGRLGRGARLGRLAEKNTHLVNAFKAKQS